MENELQPLTFMPYAGHAYDMVGWNLMSTNKFKVGDRAWFQGRVTHGGGQETLHEYPSPTEVIIKEVKPEDQYLPNGRILVSFVAHHHTYWVHEHTLTPIPSPTESPVFKVGDRVWFQGQIAGTKHYFRTPVEAEIVAIDQGSVLAEFETLKAQYYVSKSQLSLLSPQSPQPQTTEPKEDMKPYVVIYHDLNTGGPAQIQSHHVTEEEAKESAEILIAGQRASKRYFAVTIVNTKTGKLVGSVVDAPPAVEWKTE